MTQTQTHANYGVVRAYRFDNLEESLEIKILKLHEECFKAILSTVERLSFLEDRIAALEELIKEE